MCSRLRGLLALLFLGLMVLSAAPRRPELKELKEWKAKIGIKYFLYPGIPIEKRPEFYKIKDMYYSKAPIEEQLILTEVYKDPYTDNPKLEFKQIPSNLNCYYDIKEFSDLIKEGIILDHSPGPEDPKPTIIKNIELTESIEKENKRIVTIVFLILSILIVITILAFIYFVRRSARTKKNLPPTKPLPHPALRSWLCASCGWLGFVGRNGNPYDVGVGVGTAAAGAGAVGVVAGGAGLAGGVIVILIGLAVFIVGIPLLLLFGLGLIFMMLGIVIMVVGGIISLVGGTAAGAGATIAASGAAAGAGAYAKGQAYDQRALPCPVCKQALIPCSSTMGKQFISNHPEVLVALGPPIQEWLEYVRFYEHKTGTMIHREPWPGANQIPALAIEEPTLIDTQERESQTPPDTESALT